MQQLSCDSPEPLRLTIDKCVKDCSIGKTCPRTAYVFWNYGLKKIHKEE